MENNFLPIADDIQIRCAVFTIPETRRQFLLYLIIPRTNIRILQLASIGTAVCKVRYEAHGRVFIGTFFGGALIF